MRVAVIDIGSNSTLLLIGERVGAGWRVLLDTARITRLGEGFSHSQTLQPQAIERTLRAIQEYLAIGEAHGVKRVLAVATAAVREARNREALVELLPASVEFTVLSESDEARYSFLSAARDPDLFVGEDADATESVRVASAGTPTNHSPLLAVLDIGGGSVEVAIGRSEVEHWFSCPVGAGRIRETHMPSDPPNLREVLQATRALDEAFAPLRELPQPDRVVAVGGTGVNLAMLALGRAQFDPMAAHGVW
ncbi:MAG: hypothetical protein NZM28_00740, partial [Fimbriimonadales bacterium]|nr:hypothetical protein [Fimbriimonadales bacterium]